MENSSVVPYRASDTTTGKRVYCLYRVSTNQQVDHDSNNEADIPMQRLECHRFAERMGWTIIHEEQEEGVSGHKVRAENRDKLQLIKKAAMEKEFDILLVFMFDRIGRIQDETPFVVEWFVRNGIRVWSTQEGEQKFETHADKLMNYIRFWAADGESEKTSIRTSTRLGQIVEGGNYTGGTHPYGYKLERRGRMNKKGHELYDLVIDEDEAPLVRFIFDKYVSEGRGAQSLANLLNSMGLKNRSGQNWHPSTIRAMLKNITYIGILRSGESRSEQLPDLQIIDDQTFNAAQQITAQRSRSYAGNRHIPLNIKGRSLLAGNIFCGHCGARLSLTTNGKGRIRNDGTDYIRVRYVCQTKTRKHAPCDGQTGYTTHILDGMIEDMLHKAFGEVESFTRAEVIAAGGKAKTSEYKAIAKRVQRDYIKAEKDLESLKAEVIKSIQGESAFPTDLLNRLIQDAEKKCAEQKEALERAEADVAESENTAKDLAAQYDQVIEWSKAFDNASMERKKMIAAQLIERVDVYKGYDLKVKFTVNIEQFLIGLDLVTWAS